MREEQDLKSKFDLAVIVATLLLTVGLGYNTYRVVEANRYLQEENEVLMQENHKLRLHVEELAAIKISEFKPMYDEWRD